MGKLFRYGMAGVMVATAGFCLAAIYASRHPDSFFVKYGRPVGQAVIKEAGRVILKPSSRPGLDSEDTSSCVPDYPGPTEEAIPAVQAPQLPLYHYREKGEFYFGSVRSIDNQLTEAVREQLPPIPFQDAEEPPLADGTKVAATPEAPLVSEPPLALSPGSADPHTGWEGLPVEIAEGEQKMPRCYDDDEDIPSRMPHAEESETPASSDALFRFWLDLFRNVSEESAGQEESEALDVDVPPPCQEDPVYHYQYPGCPFTGKCPFLDPPALRSDPSLREHKEKNRPMTPDFDPNELSVPERLKRLLPQTGSEEEELLPPPNVDTTEFRPSDARPGEFDPQPM